MMQIKDMSDDQWFLLFDIHRSIRYHDKRKAFFETLHRVTNVITIMFAGNVLWTATHSDAGNDPTWLTCIALFGSIIAAVDLVVGYAAKASTHNDLKRKFCDLEIEIRCKARDELDLSSISKQRLEIERDEPPIYRALDLICYNETVNAFFPKDEAPKNRKQLAAPYRWTMHIIHWHDLTA
jgi:hypothetical protein